MLLLIVLIVLLYPCEADMAGKERKKEREEERKKGRESTPRHTQRLVLGLLAAPVGLKSLSHSKIFREGLLAMGSEGGHGMETAQGHEESEKYIGILFME
jgi:hypothetical protein